MDLIERICEAEGWRKPKKKGEGHYQIRFGFWGGLVSRNGTNLQIWLKDQGDFTRVHYKASNFGLLTGVWIRRTLEEFRSMLQQSVMDSLEVYAHASQIKSGDDPSGALRQLEHLKESGLITEDEYQSKRQDILARL